MNNVKRKVINWGMFTPNLIKGKRISNLLMKSIYNKFKSQGFRETPWQLIFDKQIAGLVLPHKDGKNEIHIRFFEDRIFAEFEIGRAYLSHFFENRFNANHYIIERFKSLFTDKEIEFIEKNISVRKQRSQEKNMETWDGYSDLFENSRGREKAVWSLVAIFYIIDTKAFFSLFILLTIFLSISITNSTLYSVAATTLAGGLTYRFLPSKGKP